MRRPPYLPAQEQPFCEINTTPMIDVMLVLLIMLMLTLPSPTHKVPIELPVAGADSGPPPPVHLLALDQNGATTWDAVPVSFAGLTQRLKEHAADARGPILQLQTDPGAPYVRFDETLAQVKFAGITRIGFVGNPLAY
ncbi:MAG: hypothetical protein RLZZ366_734 [Pseudomonadota bacterium]|jgi:biopolymer transport protein ExbD